MERWSAGVKRTERCFTCITYIYINLDFEIAR